MWNPKTMVVKSLEHGGQKVTINESDFDAAKHEKIVPARAKLTEPVNEPTGKPDPAGSAGAGVGGEGAGQKPAPNPSSASTGPIVPGKPAPAH